MNREMDNLIDQAGLPHTPARLDSKLAGRFRRGIWPAVIMSGCLALLLVASRLTPDPSGAGTHTQLGLPGCSVLYSTGFPCATCGMTTAFAYAANGQLWQAVVTQPAGAVAALLTAAAAIVCGYALIFDLSLEPLVVQLWRVQTIIAFGALILGAWLYKALVIQGIL